MNMIAKTTLIILAVYFGLGIVGILIFYFSNKAAAKNPWKRDCEKK